MQNHLNCTILIWGLILREGLVLAGGKNTGRLMTAGRRNRRCFQVCNQPGKHTSQLRNTVGSARPAQAPRLCQVAWARCTLTLL